MKYVLIDGNYQLYRAAYSGKESYNREGVFTGGTIVFLQMLRNLCNWGGKPIVVFDHSRAAWRYDIYPEYKKRPPKSEEEQRKKVVYFGTTRSILIELIPRLGIPVLIIQDQEGDDVLYRLSQGLIKQEHNVLVVSDDGDYLQFCKEGVHIYQPMKDLFWSGQRLYDHEKEFNPHSFLLHKCLIGDKSDNITNPPGIGPVAADKIISELTEYSIASLVQWAITEPTSKLKDKVRPHLKIVKRNWLLMNLDHIPLTIEETMMHYQRAETQAIPDYKYVFQKFVELEINNLSSWLIAVGEKVNRRMGR